jgi:hypothetical protein
MAHQVALLDFVDRREIGPGTREALEHLDTCRPCGWDLEATALAIAALRRLFAEAEHLEPPPDAWIRLRARVERPRAVWRWRTALGGILVSTGLVATLVGPLTVRPQPGLLDEAAPAGQRSEARLAEERAEGTWFAQLRVNRVPPSDPIHLFQIAAGARSSGPDGIPIVYHNPTPEPAASRAD